jgi:uncharacterized protein YdaT
MPWTASDAKKKTKKASTPKLQSQWSAIANRMLASGAEDSDAIKTANGVIKRRTEE